MTDRHFLFTDEMVRRILSGEKTQTRRPINPQPSEHFDCELPMLRVDGSWQTMGYAASKVARIGDVLIGRECHRVSGGITGVRVDYRAGGHRIVEREMERVGDALVHYLPDVSTMERPRGRWCPSIHMPRWAARIVRPITGVRVERLQDITEADAVAEGFGHAGTRHAGTDARHEFACVWDDLYVNRGMGWAFNPWVVVVEFEGAK